MTSAREKPVVAEAIRAVDHGKSPATWALPSTGGAICKRAPLRGAVREKDASHCPPLTLPAVQRGMTNLRTPPVSVRAGGLGEG